MSLTSFAFLSPCEGPHLVHHIHVSQLHDAQIKHGRQSNACRKEQGKGGDALRDEPRYAHDGEGGEGEWQGVECQKAELVAGRLRIVTRALRRNTRERKH